MIVLILFLACVFVSLGAGLMAAASDVRGLVIANIYSVIVAASFFAAFIIVSAFGPEGVFASFWSHLTAGILVFAITAALFGARMIGAADSKLCTVYAFWMAMRGLPAFLFYTTLAGGVLALIALGLRKWKPVKNPKEGGWVARVQAGENKVPYGAAIVCGALASFLKLGYLGPESLSSFLPN